MTKNKEVIYHFTNKFSMQSIARSAYLNLTEGNFVLGKPMPPVLWLTTSPTPENHGLYFDKNTPDGFDKTEVRFTIRKRDFMLNWAEWHERTGRSAEEKEILIATAGAEETHKTWYISLIPLPMGEVLLVENLKTGEVYYEKPTKKKKA